MKTLLGGLTIEEQKGLTSMPQKAASAWVAAEGGIVGAGYKPLVYVGTQLTKNITYWFIAEQTLILAEPERHIVKIAVSEFKQPVEGSENEFETVYKVIPHSIERIF